MARPERKLRTGWTTGACATAAAKSAAHALFGGEFLDPVEITLPGGARARFSLAEAEPGAGFARAGVIKDAGDDPDVTHGVLVRARVRRGPRGTGIEFVAGEGVGLVTRPGLPIAPGEPAINPVPRRMIVAALGDVAEAHDESADFTVEISIPGGAELAEKTLNPRLGIEGGLSILGTTGIVRPFSCSAWIASIRSAIDVARASGLGHIAASTGTTSQARAQALYGLPDVALIEMGDFAGGMLKYLRRHPLPRLTIIGGAGKMTKLAQGALDLHSRRSRTDFARLGRLAAELGLDGDAVAASNTALAACEVAGPRLAGAVAARARQVALDVLAEAPVAVETIVIDRGGNIIGRAGF